MLQQNIVTGKSIEAINIWLNGENKTGVKLCVNCISDNYENSATNYWQIFDADGQQIASSNLTITGQDYIDWGDQPAMAINSWIYNWCAEQLGLTII